MSSPANTRIIIVFYVAEKKLVVKLNFIIFLNVFLSRLFVGFIPHNQDEFLSSMKEMVETAKKEQHVKQKMVYI